MFGYKYVLKSNDNSIQILQGKRLEFLEYLLLIDRGYPAVACCLYMYDG